MHRQILFVAPLLFSLSSAAQIPNQLRNCWDGSFAYNVATLKVDGEIVEVGATGQFLLFDEIDTANGISDVSGIPLGVGYHNESIFAAFANEQCASDAGGAIVCEMSSPQDEPFLVDTVFVGRTLRDLDNFVSTITPVFLDGVRVEISADNFKLELFDDSFGEERRVGLIDIPLFICDEDGRSGNTHFGNAYFPERLRAYLAAAKSKS